jgi:urease accessory protein
MGIPIALLQLASPALPIGGYSYSGGLEWAIESGQVHDEASAAQWISDALQLTIARFDAPLMLAALRTVCAAREADDLDQPREAGSVMDALRALNDAARAARETEELRLESQQMGYSLGRWLAAVCPEPKADAMVATQLDPLTLPVAWALACDRLALDDEDALLGYCWTFVENQAMVLMKALPMGQIAAQRLLRGLHGELAQAIDSARALPRQDWSSAAPLLAVASSRHESQYSRLFRS